MDGPRILVMGNSGSGKTTLARAAAARLGVPHVELDAIRHQANWRELPDPEFRVAVAEHAAGERWVIDGNYNVVRDLTLARATAVVWVDPPLATVMGQVAWRSLRRAILREELWNGNRERVRDWVSAGHPIRWAWRTHAKRQAAFAAMMDKRWVRLRSRGEARRWLASLRDGDA